MHRILSLEYDIMFNSYRELCYPIEPVAIWAFNFDTEAFFHCGTIDWEKRERERDERK